MQTTTWAAKSAAEEKGYLWKPPIEQGDGLSSVSVAVSAGTVTATAQTEGYGVRVEVSGGAAGEEARLTVTANTTGGRTYIVAVHLPVRATIPLYTNTARDVVSFALRKITGIGETPTASEQETGIEVLNDMLGHWRIGGKDVGVAAELTANDTLEVPETYLAAIKYNLALWLAEEFDRPVTQNLYDRANETKRQLENALLQIEDLRHEDALLRRRNLTNWENLS